MSRIDEIKEMLERIKQNPTLMVPYKGDVEYLLSRLEITDNALDVARKHIDGTHTKFSERERTPVLFQINEALKQLRE